ncbi:MAG: hypothetical protein QXI58_04370 [Candidatus Micrarchaeia archaeon]
MKYIVYLVFPFLIFSWTTPINISQNPLNDINPQVCRLWNPFSYTCVVWQREEGNLYNIFARFSMQIGEWGQEIRVTDDSIYSNENPVVAYDEIRNKVWVAWQKNLGNNWEIFVTSGEPNNGFSPPYQLTNSANRDDKNPTIFCIRDTVWVIWESWGDSSFILSKFYNGDEWSESIIIAQCGASEAFLSQPKITIRYSHPIVIWYKWSRCFSHIYYSEYINGNWTQPAAVCTSGHNYTIEINNNSLFYLSGVIIVWYNNETQDIFKTAYDTFNLHYNITNDTDIVDIYPSVLIVDIPVFNLMPYIIVWQRENKIYSHFWYASQFIPVDTTFTCEKPTLTAMGSTCVWCVYQKNINGNYEIFGSYVYYSDIKEDINKKPSILRKKIILSKKYFDLKKYKIYNPLGKEVKNCSYLPLGVYFILK